MIPARGLWLWVLLAWPGVLATAAEGPPAKAVTKIEIQTGHAVDLIVTADGRLTPTIFTLPGDRLVIDFPAVLNLTGTKQIPVGHPLVKRVRLGQHPDKLRVVVDLTRQVPYRTHEDGHQWVLTVGTTADERQDHPQDSRSSGSHEGNPTTTTDEVAPHHSHDDGSHEGRAMPVQASAPELPGSMSMADTTFQQYTGTKISLDLQNAEIRAVIRLIADASELNLIISEDVKGAITLKLVEVPWDQALALILQMQGLGMLREGNIMQIASQAAIASQLDAAAKTQEQILAAGPLVTKVLQVNYAKAADVRTVIEKNLTSRGKLEIDERTNALIVKDVASSVQEAMEMLATLDTPTPQVMIEARIVQALPSFVRSLGVQWGFAYGQASGNAAIGLQGGLAGAAPTFSLVPGAPALAVNAPASLQNAGLNFALGRFTGNPLTLALRLSAGETQGLTRTVSTPRILVLDNEEARIVQGEQIPFATVSQDGTQTQLVTAALTLTVTPRITPDGSIIMKVVITDDAPGEEVPGVGLRIFKREASTKVVVRDAETVVIGGVFVQVKTETESGVPYLRRIPIIGWLFKNRTVRDEQRELLVFLTPRIVR